MDVQPIECELCGKDIMDPRRYKSHIDLHMKKKEYDIDKIGKIKEQIEIDHMNKVKNYFCELCEKGFTTPYALKNHQEKSCNGGQDSKDIVVLKRAYKILEKTKDLGKLREFQKLVEERVSNVIECNIPGGAYSNVKGDRNTAIQDSVVSNNNNTTTTTNTNSNNNINYNYNIAINNLNKENTGYLVDLLPDLKEQLLKIGEHNSYIKHVKREAFEDMKKILIQLYSLIHLNDDHPENQNIYISNLKQNIPFFIHVNDEWVRHGSMDHLQNVVGKTYQVLIDSLTRLIDLTDDVKFKDELLNVQIQIQDIYPLYEDQLKKNVSRQCFQLTYGNRDNVARIYKASREQQLKQIAN